MTDTNLSEAQIEKAAEAAYTEWARHTAVSPDWDDLKHSQKECWRYIVTAAAPYLREYRAKHRECVKSNRVLEDTRCATCCKADGVLHD